MSEAEIQEELLTGETVLWTGQPLRQVIFHPSDWYAIPFSLLWGGGVERRPRRQKAAVFSIAHLSRCMSTILSVRNTSKLVVLTTALSLTSCSTAHRHRVIVYDQPWSSDAGVRNLWCAPQLKVACAERALREETAFSQRLAIALSSVPECATVSFTSLNGRNADLARELKANPHYQYWRLRVDFHPGMDHQPYTLGPGEDRSRIGGDDAEHTAEFMCKAVKNNGVISVW